MWGQDWTIDKDFKVIAKSARKPNVAIPADGGVISANETGGDVHMNVRKLMAKDQVTILAGYAEEGKEFPVLKTKVDSKATTLVLVFGSRLWMFTDRPCAAAKILIETTKGRICVDGIYANPC